MSLYSHDIDAAIAFRGELDFQSLVAALGASQAVSRTAACAVALSSRPLVQSRRDAMIALLTARPGWAICADRLGHSFDSGTASLLRSTQRKGS